MADVTIQVLKNGPYLVKGPVELKDADGKVIPAKDGFALCRCGQSAGKPFCDGAHKKANFQG
ncbi:MAG: CDGSH iron-sulfur domain-containing protein [Candidatus Omnitrophica bacterium]|nr:CDGSH iron-sulfur domain-containing protein [Candidatus Omnitrophota bacterium]